MSEYSITPTLLDNFYWCQRLNKIQELVYKINGVKTPMSKSAMRGVAFESVVNALLLEKETEVYESVYIKSGFTFDKSVTDRIVRKLSGYGTMQKKISAVIDTPVGKVRLHGKVDYAYKNMHVDLKTTRKYATGKYGGYNQHGSYSLIEKTNGTPIEYFNYLVTDFTNVYIEPYEIEDSLHRRVIGNICDFTTWLEKNRALITNEKIFSL
jgi:hypothetical protein